MAPIKLGPFGIVGTPERNICASDIDIEFPIKAREFSHDGTTFWSIC